MKTESIETCKIIRLCRHLIFANILEQTHHFYSKDPNRNVILWQDHRAVQEAAEINSTQHPVLRFVGGALSPEMQSPKLLWLKRHLYSECWEKAGHFFDLADYLTYRATGESSR